MEQSIQLFHSKGFSETSIQDIVNALGATKGTFYYYFASKEQLLMEIHSQYINELLAEQQQIVSDSAKSCKEKLLENMELLIRQIKTHGHQARVFIREMQNLSEENVLIIKEKREEFRVNLETIIREGVAAGEFRHDVRADMVTFGILGMCNWSYNWYNPSGVVSDRELAEIYYQMVTQGIC
jgi:AcrR family transcriptional regulator